MFDPEQLQRFRESLDRNLMKHVDAGISPRRSILRASPGGRSSTLSKPTNFDFGNYPMTPWLNSKNNPGQTTMKVEDVKKRPFFMTPKNRDDLFVIPLSRKSPAEFEIPAEQIKQSKLIERSWIDNQLLDKSITQINEVLRPYKERQEQNDRKISLYMIIGLALMAVLAIVLGIVVHFGLAIAMILIYIITMIVVVRKLVTENDRLTKQIHFNLCLLIRNENERLFEKHSIKAKVGQLSRWIEFHGVSQHSVFGIELEQIEESVPA